MNPFLSNTQMTQLCVAASVSMLIYYNSIRKRHHVTRSGILAPNHSPWPHMYQNGDEGYYINLTGFSREEFEEMHDYLYTHELEKHCASRPKYFSALFFDVVVSVACNHHGYVRHVI